MIRYKINQLIVKQLAVSRKRQQRLTALATAGLLACPFFSPVVTAVGLNDTGQSLCYDGSNMVACTEANTGDASPYPGQDGRYGRDAAATAGVLAKIGGGAAGFDFTALDAAGNPTTPSSGPMPHACVRDNVTGLTWEVKTNDNKGLHDKDWRYVWYSTDSTTNGGSVGSNVSANDCGGTLTSCNTEAFVAAVNAAGWCGFHDWRLPTTHELLNIVHSGIKIGDSPTIDTTYFPNTEVDDYFWSATSSARTLGAAWLTNVYGGTAQEENKASNTHVRLVRGGQF